MKEILSYESISQLVIAVIGFLVAFNVNTLTFPNFKPLRCDENYRTTGVLLLQ